MLRISWLPAAGGHENEDRRPSRREWPESRPIKNGVPGCKLGFLRLSWGDVTGDAFQYPDLRTRPIEHAKAESEGDSDPAIRAMYWSIIARGRGDDPNATRNVECSRAALPNI